MAMDRNRQIVRNVGPRRDQLPDEAQEAYRYSEARRRLLGNRRLGTTARPYWETDDRVAVPPTPDPSDGPDAGKLPPGWDYLGEIDRKQDSAQQKAAEGQGRK